MSVEGSAVASEASVGLASLKSTPNAIYISHDELSRLIANGSGCVILPFGTDFAGEASCAESDPPPTRAGIWDSSLNAIAIGTVIGATTGLSTTLAFMPWMLTSNVDVVSMISQALRFFT